jgi:glyoxylase-like metal-dependent hydrolase (beta-lactamase superfamily II)
MTSKDRKIYALKIGERDIPSINHLYMEENAPPRMISCMYLWCIMDCQGPIIVDQGFSIQTLKNLNITFRMDAEPPELLRRIGIDPKDVRTVVLTHLHWDHYSGEEFFPQATYYLQRREMEFVVGPMIQYRALGRFFNPAAVEKIFHLHLQGKVVLIEGDRELFPGIELLWTGGHTPGSQAIAAETGSGTAVICSDVVPRYQNLEENIPCGIHTSTLEAVMALEKIRGKTGSMDLIIPGHDPAVSLKFPQVAEGVFLVTPG